MRFERKEWAGYPLEQLFDCLKLGPVEVIGCRLIGDRRGVGVEVFPEARRSCAERASLRQRHPQIVLLILPGRECPINLETERCPDDPNKLVRDLQDRFPTARLIGGDAEYECWRAVGPLCREFPARTQFGARMTAMGLSLQGPRLGRTRHD